MRVLITGGLGSKMSGNNQMPRQRCDAPGLAIGGIPMTARDDTRSALGRFIRSRQPWTPDNWDDGYFDNRGRFRVYRPDFPRAYALGYALRTHVVWWLAHGEPHPEGTDLHHINENRGDDRLENLRVLSHGEHTRLHKPKRMKRCLECGREFYKKKKPQAKFCTYLCYSRYPKSDVTREKMSAGQKRRRAGER
jgi:HNH endonuclease